MSHTNETTYYGLPQFVGTDILDPLTDTNNAYQKIDTALHNVAENSGQASEAAQQAVEDVGAMQGVVAGHTTAIEGLSEDVAESGANIAEAFSPDGVYLAGKVVSYNGLTYKFTANHNGPWTGLDAERWIAGDSVTAVEKDVAANTTQVGRTRANIAPAFDADESYLAGRVVDKDGVTYMFTADHSGAWTGLDVVQWVVSEDIADMKVNFQDGVDTIYDAIVAQGVTPSASTPTAIAEGIADVRSEGRKDVGNTFVLKGTQFAAGSNVDTDVNVDVNHYLILFQNVDANSSSTSYVSISSGATKIGSDIIQYNSSMDTTSIVTLYKTTATSITIHKTGLFPTLTLAVQLGECE